MSGGKNSYMEYTCLATKTEKQQRMGNGTLVIADVPDNAFLSASYSQTISVSHATKWLKFPIGALVAQMIGS